MKCNQYIGTFDALYERYTKICCSLADQNQIFDPSPFVPAFPENYREKYLVLREIFPY